MKTPPVNKTLRSYVDFDFDDNPPHIGELTLMFGQLAMCVNPWAGYGATRTSQKLLKMDGLA
jgi:hypothetical protein